MAAMGIVGASLLGTVLSPPDWSPSTWVMLVPFAQLCVAVVVAWVSTRLRVATTPQLERAQNVRVVLAVPLVGPGMFVLVFAGSHDLSAALLAAVAGTVGGLIAAFIGYRRWTQHTGTPDPTV